MHDVYLVSLGCDKNRVDGEVMIGNLRNAGFTVVSDPSVAQVIIVNTCGFISDAVQESIDLVLELSSYKNEGNCKGLIVVGCMSERYHVEIKESMPEIDAVLGVKEYDKIAKFVADLVGADLNKMTKNPNQADPFLARLQARTDDVIPHIAYVKISEGCDNNCTYCTIPSIRGAYTSRTMENILEECRQLIVSGTKEIVLVAQDTALYGTDIYKEKKLPELLYKIAKLDNTIWIRLMYAYPEHITEELINAMAEIPQVCKYIDMPIQHSEDTVLKKMGRASSKHALTTLIQNMREKIKGIAIRTTLIVGFPGETEEDFKGLYQFVKEMKFDRLGVFPYSREDGTPAAKMKQQVNPETKQTRHGKLMALQQDIHFKKQSEMVDKEVIVIVDGKSENPNEYIGRTSQDAYEVDAIVYISSNEELKPGKFFTVKITHATEYDLHAVLTSTK